MQDIVIRGLCKAFDGKQVLRDFSAALPAGRLTRPPAPPRRVRPRKKQTDIRKIFMHFPKKILQKKIFAKYLLPETGPRQSKTYERLPFQKRNIPQ